MKYVLLVLLIAALAACTTSKPDVVLRDRVVTVNKPVLQPCVGERPAPPPTVSERISDAEWHALSGIQALVEAGKSGLDWFRYSQRLETETSGCE